MGIKGKIQMAVPKNKEELIFEIENNYSKLRTDLETIPSELTKKKKNLKDTQKELK